MSRDAFASWEVCLMHSNTIGTVIQSAKTIQFGYSNVPDTSRWMGSTRRFVGLCVESSTWPLVCPVSFTELCVCRRVCVDSLDFDSFQGCVLRVCRVSLACSTVRGIRSPQLPTRQQNSGRVRVGVSRIVRRTSKVPVRSGIVDPMDLWWLHLSQLIVVCRSRSRHERTSW